VLVAAASCPIVSSSIRSVSWTRRRHTAAALRCRRERAEPVQSHDQRETTRDRRKRDR
jgi:hypothetical protein